MPGICALMGATRLASGYFQHFTPYPSASAHCHIKPIPLGVSPYVLAATRTSVRGRPPRSGLMSLCSYVLMFPALAAAMSRYGVSPYVSYSMGRSHHTKVMFLMFLCLRGKRKTACFRAKRKEICPRAKRKEKNNVTSTNPIYSACFGIFTAIASIMRRYTPLSSSMRFASWRVSSLICSIVPTCLLIL